MSNKHPQKQIKHTVFYDGACGLCAKEIKYYKHIAPKNTFNWVDVTRDLEIFESLGYTQEQGLKALHAQDDKGKMHIGVDAFILIWRHLKYW